MASCIKYVFFSQNTARMIQFDGPFMSVGELRNLIVERHHLEDRRCLLLSDRATGKEYEDADVVARSSVVLCRRVPGQNHSRVLVGATPLPPPAASASTSPPEEDAADNVAQLPSDVARARDARVGDGGSSSASGLSTGWGKRTRLGERLTSATFRHSSCETGHVKEILDPASDDPELDPLSRTARPRGISGEATSRPEDQEDEAAGRGGGGRAARRDVAQEIEELLNRPTFRTLQQMAPPVPQTCEMPPVYEVWEMPQIGRAHV